MFRSRLVWLLGLMFLLVSISKSSAFTASLLSSCRGLHRTRASRGLLSLPLRGWRAAAEEIDTQTHTHSLSLGTRAALSTKKKYTPPRHKQHQRAQIERSKQSRRHKASDVECESSDAESDSNDNNDNNRERVRELRGVVVERLGDRLLVKALPEEEREPDESSPSRNNSKTHSSLTGLQQRLFICTQKSVLANDAIVAGDRVLFSIPCAQSEQHTLSTPSLSSPAISTSPDRDLDEGVVHALSPRRNILQRPGYRSNVHKLNLKNIAANIDLLCVVLSARPLVPLHTVDSFLAYAEIMRIPQCLLVVNKADLPETEELFESLSRYAEPALGYPVLRTSVESSEGIDALLQHMQGKTTIFAGQSGVGKSSLVNALFARCGRENESVRVGDLVKNDLYGAHTTSNSRLFELRPAEEEKGAGATCIIDSPGIRELSIAHFDRTKVIDGFVEIAEHAKHCQFRNCDHYIHSPRDLEEDIARFGHVCNVLKGVQEGTIDQDRFMSYKYIMNALLTR